MTAHDVQSLSEAGPQYLRIYRELKRRIQSGELVADSALPAQRELSREFDVTLMTLRQAVGLLKQEGLLVTRQGGRTRVAPQRVSYSIGPLRSLALEMAAQGVTLATRVLRVREQAAGAVAERLGLDATDVVLELQRLRLVDGQPIVLQWSYLPLWIGRGVLDADLTARSLYEVLTERFGYEVQRAAERLTPTLLGAREARLLAVEPGAATIVSERVTYVAEERAVVFDRAYLPGERLAITADRRRGNVALSYQLQDGQAN